MKRDGAFTATVIYGERTNFTYRPTLSVRRSGRLVLVRRMCPLDFAGRGTCTWVGPDTWSLMKRGPLAFRDVASTTTPGVVVDLWTGGAHCCEQTFVALLGSPPRWIAHDWGNPGYHGTRIGGRYYFVSGDNRFAYAFGAYAFSWFPAQIWTIRHGGLVNVTRSTPSLVAADATRALREYRRAGRDRLPDTGALAGWCADEYLLNRGRHCERVLQHELAAGRLRVRDAVSGRRFIRLLHHDLERWGYERS